MLNWQAHPNNSNITHYRIYEVSGTGRSQLAEVNAAMFSYWHREVEKDRTYFYACAAVNSEGREGASSYLTVL